MPLFTAEAELAEEMVDLCISHIFSDKRVYYVPMPRTIGTARPGHYQGSMRIPILTPIADLTADCEFLTDGTILIQIVKTVECSQVFGNFFTCLQRDGRMTVVAK